MWLATRFGFFSVVCGTHQSGPKDGEIDASVRMIRARSKHHLLQLQEQFADLLALSGISSNQGTDYPYRIVVSAAVFAQLMSRMVADLDYDNFKDASHAFNPDDKKYYRFLHEVWHVGRERLQ